MTEVGSVQVAVRAPTDALERDLAKAKASLDRFNQDAGAGLKTAAAAKDADDKYKALLTTIQSTQKAIEEQNAKFNDQKSILKDLVGYIGDLAEGYKGLTLAVLGAQAAAAKYAPHLVEIEYAAARGLFAATTAELVAGFAVQTAALALLKGSWNEANKTIAESVDLLSKANNQHLNVSDYVGLSKAAKELHVDLDSVFTAMQRIEKVTNPTYGGAPLQNRIKELYNLGNFQSNTGIDALNNATSDLDKFKAMVQFLDQAIAKGERLVALDIAKSILPDDLYKKLELYGTKPLDDFINKAQSSKLSPAEQYKIDYAASLQKQLDDLDQSIAEKTKHWEEELKKPWLSRESKPGYFTQFEDWLSELTTRFTIASKTLTLGLVGAPESRTGPQYQIPGSGPSEAEKSKALKQSVDDSIAAAEKWDQAMSRNTSYTNRWGERPGLLSQFTHWLASVKTPNDYDLQAGAYGPQLELPMPAVDRDAEAARQAAAQRLRTGAKSPIRRFGPEGAYSDEAIASTQENQQELARTLAEITNSNLEENLRRYNLTLEDTSKIHDHLQEALDSTAASTEKLTLDYKENEAQLARNNTEAKLWAIAQQAYGPNKMPNSVGQQITQAGQNVYDALKQKSFIADTNQVITLLGQSATQLELVSARTATLSDAEAKLGSRMNENQRRRAEQNAQLQIEGQFIDRRNSLLGVAASTEDHLLALDNKLALAKAANVALSDDEIANIKKNTLETSNGVRALQQRADASRIEAQATSMGLAAATKFRIIQEAINKDLREGTEEFKKYSKAITDAGEDVAREAVKAENARLEDHVRLERQLLGVGAIEAGVARQLDTLYKNAGVSINSTLGRQIISIDYAKQLMSEVQQMQATIDQSRIGTQTLGMNIGDATTTRLIESRIAQAKRTHENLSDSYLSSYRQKAAEVGTQAQEDAIKNLDFEIDREKKLVFLTDEQREIAEKLKGIYPDITTALDSNQGAAMRLNQVLKTLNTEASTFVSGFFKDLSHGVTAIDALKNALGRLSDTLIDMASKRLVANALGATGESFLGSFLGIKSAGSTSRIYDATELSPLDALVAHSGGLIGSSALTHRSISPSLFRNAPRFHLGVDEVPAILQRGEKVIPRGGQANSPMVVQQHFYMDGVMTKDDVANMVKESAKYAIMQSKGYTNATLTQVDKAMPARTTQRQLLGT